MESPIKLLNRYEFKEKVGYGGQGVVWKAQDTLLKREVAIKVIRLKQTRQANLELRILKEAQSLADQHIVKLYQSI